MAASSNSDGGCAWLALTICADVTICICRLKSRPVGPHPATTNTMPLPPRDLSALHVSLNPALTSLHARFPISRFVPAVGLFRLYKLAYEGSPLLGLLDLTSWLTLACLDDMGADHCISQALQAALASQWHAGSLNSALVVAAAPFVVPMLVPMPATAAAPVVACPPPPAPCAETAPRRPKPRLHGSVMRAMAAVCRDHEYKIGIEVFEEHASRLAKLSAAAASKAVLGLGERLEAEADYSADSVRAKLRAAIEQFE